MSKMQPIDQETYRIIAEAVHQATGGEIPNFHPAYLWVRENLGPLTPLAKDAGLTRADFELKRVPVSDSDRLKFGVGVG